MIECEDCDGKGYIDHIEYCGDGCCSNFIYDYECEICNGTGEVEESV